MTRLLPLALLAVFFLLNGMNGYTDLIRPIEPFMVLLVSLILAALSLFFSGFLFRNAQRSATFAAFLLFFLLFARTGLLSLKEILGPDLRTSIYLAVTATALLIIGRLIQRSSIPGLQRYHGFLILLFSTLILYETGRLVFTTPAASFRLNERIRPTAWTGERRENIYVFLFDEYQGSQGLLKLTGYNNERLEASLRNKGFTVAANPHSTYRLTFYSLPSLFSMDTLAFPDGRTGESLRLGIMANRMLDRSNTFTDYLKANGYRTLNHSMFNVGGSAKLRDLPFGLSWLELQLLKIFPWWAKHDMLHHIPSNRIQKSLGTYYARFVDYNHAVLENTLACIGQKREDPVFVYSHFLLPHNPSLFDSTGRERSFRDTHSGIEAGKGNGAKAYVEQLVYANTIIDSLVRKIDLEDPDASVVIISDHGSRHLADEKPEIFNILWAMRVKGSPVVAGEDDTELVNTFRILLNHVAGQQLPMLHSRPKY